MHTELASHFCAEEAIRLQRLARPFREAFSLATVRRTLLAGRAALLVATSEGIRAVRAADGLCLPWASLGADTLISSEQLGLLFAYRNLDDPTASSAADTQAFVVAYDLRLGVGAASELWRKRLRSRVASVAHDGEMLVCATEGRPASVVAWRAGDGQEVFRREVEETPAAIACSADVIYCAVGQKIHAWSVSAFQVEQHALAKLFAHLGASSVELEERGGVHVMRWLRMEDRDFDAWLDMQNVRIKTSACERPGHVGRRDALREEGGRIKISFGGSCGHFEADECEDLSQDVRLRLLAWRREQWAESVFAFASYCKGLGSSWDALKSEEAWQLNLHVDDGGGGDGGASHSCSHSMQLLGGKLHVSRSVGGAFEVLTLEAASGLELQRHRTLTPISQLLHASGTVYMSTLSKTLGHERSWRITACNIADGLVWKNGAGGETLTRMLLVGDVLCAGTVKRPGRTGAPRAGRVLAWRSRTGVELWRCLDLDGGVGHLAHIDRLSLLVSTHGRSVVARRLSDGFVVWRKELSPRVSVSSMVVAPASGGPLL